nr:hypothetical protein [Actinomadura madurae]
MITTSRIISEVRKVKLDGSTVPSCAAFSGPATAPVTAPST